MRHGGFIDSRYSKPRWGMAQVKPFLWKVRNERLDMQEHRLSLQYAGDVLSIWRVSRD
jgi:hypothetical protein